MCGRLVQVSSPELLVRAFGATSAISDEHRPRHNVAPSSRIPAIIERETRRLGDLEWGFIPSWASDPRAGPRPINARSEGVVASRLFGPAVRTHRCIAPVDAWYEWATVAGRKQPYLLRPSDREPAAVAAIWSMWRSEDEGTKPRGTIALLTTAARGVAADIHDRMPLLVPTALLQDWLDPTSLDPSDARALIEELAARPVDLEVAPVDTRVNDARFDDPTLSIPTGPFRSDRA
jgi:putative SOS response-associated peptidase YedK